jgi:autotransporter-associated beta strand protein
LWLYDSTGAGAISVVGGSHSIAVPVFTESALELNVNSAGASLALSGSLAESGAAVAVQKTGSGVLKLLAPNSFTGGLTIAAGTVLVGNSLALGSGPVVVGAGALLDATGATLSTGSVTLANGALRLYTGSPLTSSGVALLNGSISVTGAATLGRYTLLAAPSVSGTFSTGSLSDATNYYLTLSSTELGLQHRATIGSVSAVPVAASIITGGSVAINVSVGNQAPVASDALSFTLTAGNNVAGSASASGVPAQGISVASGLVFTGTTVGAAQTGSFAVTGSNASNGPVSSSVAVNVFAHAAPTVLGGTLILPAVIEDYAGSIQTGNALIIGNSAGYRSALYASGGTLANRVTLSNPISGLPQNTSASMAASLAPGRPSGVVNELFSLTYADDTSLAGASLNLGTLAVTVSGTVYAHAQTAFTGGSLLFPNQREGYAATVQSTGSLNVSAAAGTLRVALRSSAASAGGISVGSLSGLAPGTTGVLGASLAPGSAAGPVGGTLNITFADDSNLN